MFVGVMRVVWISLVVLAGTLNGTPHEFARAFCNSTPAERVLPPPPSARVAVERVYETLMHVRGKGAVCDLLELQAAVRFDEKLGRELVHVMLSVDFPSSDMLGGTKAYEALKAAIQEWVRPLDLREKRVTPLADGKGIRMEALELDLDLTDENPLIIARNESYLMTDMERAVRVAGDHPWLMLGNLICEPSVARVRSGAVDDRMQIRPSQRDWPYSDERVNNYAKLLERDARLTVTAFALRSLVRTEPKGWTFELTVTHRHAAGD